VSSYTWAAGGTSGLGMETARVLVKRGARVILAIRNLNLGEAVKAEFLKETPGARVLLMHLDLSGLISFRNFAGTPNFRSTFLCEFPSCLVSFSSQFLAGNAASGGLVPLY
jgi:NAD(P)-dependent dehydrogenase (short-subunit alcohol dehydrogenase family)